MKLLCASIVALSSASTFDNQAVADTPGESIMEVLLPMKYGLKDHDHWPFLDDLPWHVAVEIVEQGAIIVIEFIVDIIAFCAQNLVDHRQKIADRVIDMGRVCTPIDFHGYECAKDVGKIISYVLLGDGRTQLSTELPSSFIGGMTKGLLGDSEHFEACSANTVVIKNETQQLVDHVHSHNWGAVVNDVEEIVAIVEDSLSRHQSPEFTNSTPIEKGACWDALGDFKPLLNFMRDGPLSIPGNLKHNFLEADADILELMKLSKHCTFADPNTDKCGYMVGAITRDILAGLDTENQVMV